MKILSVFNNKGGVGKTTLTFHLAHILSELDYKVLIIDADPQCNLTIYSMSEETIHDIWDKEDFTIDNGIDAARETLTIEKFNGLLATPRSIHFLLKPTEDGTSELDTLPPPYKISNKLDLIPGRLSLHTYEEKIASRWSDAYRGDPLAIRTLTKIRSIAEEYTKINDYDFVIVDTSPSLGALNKVIISTVDGFFIPALPDLFSLYGIRNIGRSLKEWKKDFDILYKLISIDKRKSFPTNFVSFLGYTIYNAKPYRKQDSLWSLAKAHQRYAEQIPTAIKEFIDEDLRKNLDDETLAQPIGGTSIMHSHNTLPAMAQQYNVPMWSVPGLVPDVVPEKTDESATILGQKIHLLAKKNAYEKFAVSLIKRIDSI